jgi:hypothetical protein
MYYILTKKGCEKCERLKAAIGTPANVVYLDGDEPKDMAKASYYQALKEPLPCLIDSETEEILSSSWIDIARRLGA